MKALIRNEGETVTEDMHIPGIDWETGMPLTSPDWAGGPYTLVQDYVPPVEEEETVQVTAPIAEVSAEETAEEPAEVVEVSEAPVTTETKTSSTTSYGPIFDI